MTDSPYDPADGLEVDKSKFESCYKLNRPHKKIDKDESRRRTKLIKDYLLSGEKGCFKLRQLLMNQGFGSPSTIVLARWRRLAKQAIIDDSNEFKD